MASWISHGMRSVYKSFATASMYCTVSRESARAYLTTWRCAVFSERADADEQIQSHAFLGHAGGSTPLEREAATPEIIGASFTKTDYLWPGNSIPTVLCETMTALRSSRGPTLSEPGAATPEIIRQPAARIVCPRPRNRSLRSFCEFPSCTTHLFSSPFLPRRVAGGRLRDAFGAIRRDELAISRNHGGGSSFVRDASLASQDQLQ
jgi:hypothetical protein